MKQDTANGTLKIRERKIQTMVRKVGGFNYQASLCNTEYMRPHFICPFI